MKARTIPNGSDFPAMLMSLVKKEISEWDKKDVYAVYFGVQSNAVDGNIPHFYIGCGRNGSTHNMNEKWHLAVFSDNEKELTEDKSVADALTCWLHSVGVDNIGYEGKDTMYNESMIYIGKGPAGTYELLELGVGIAQQLFKEGFIREAFGKDIPVIFDDLETTWYCVEATKAANPEGLAEEYLRKNALNNRRAAAANNIAEAAMSSVGAFGILSMLPNTLFAMLMTLIAGGIHIPVTGGGIAKCVLIGLSVIMDISKKINTHGLDGKTKAKQAAVFVVDLILTCVMLFSHMFIPDRVAALVMLVIVVIVCVSDSMKAKKTKE